MVRGERRRERERGRERVGLALDRDSKSISVSWETPGHRVYAGCVLVMMSVWNSKVWTDMRTKVATDLTVCICMCACLYVILSRQILWMNVPSVQACVVHVLYGCMLQIELRSTDCMLWLLNMNLIIFNCKVLFLSWQASDRVIMVKQSHLFPMHFAF